MSRNRDGMSAYQLEEYTQKLFVLASEKLRIMGVFEKRVVRRKNLLAHMSKTMGIEQVVSDIEFVELFLAGDEPVGAVTATPPKTPPSIASRRPYKMPIELRLAAKRAQAEQPELISVNGKLRFINNGGERD